MSIDGSHPAGERVQAEILAYLAAHPEAGDTLEGIAQWWLLEQEIRAQVELVARAARELVRKGLILEQRVPDNRTLFRISESGLKEILKRGESLRGEGARGRRGDGDRRR